MGKKKEIRYLKLDDGSLHAGPLVNQILDGDKHILKLLQEFNANDS